jgi:hypothetical protein
LLENTLRALLNSAMQPRKLVRREGWINRGQNLINRG